MASASSPSKLNKQLYIDIINLGLLNNDNAQVRFRCDALPFTGNENDNDIAVQDRKDYVITGQIFPTSDIYRERSYRIEMKLTPSFPVNPPEVRFLTRIYHPNVDKDGKFSNELLRKDARWKPTTSLIQVIKAVVDQVDNPNIHYPMRAEVARQYEKERAEFNRIARENVREHGLLR